MKTASIRMFFFVIATAVASSAGAAELVWTTDLPKAQAQAKAEKK